MTDRDLFEATFVERATARGFSHPERLLTKDSDGEYWLQTTQNCWIGWCWSQAQVRSAQDIIDSQARELSAVSTAIGTDAYLDPPDGGSVSLGEQVRRMRDEMVRLLQRVIDADQTDHFQSVAELMDDIETVLQRHQQ